VLIKNINDIIANIKDESKNSVVVRADYKQAISKILPNSSQLMLMNSPYYIHSIFDLVLDDPTQKMAIGRILKTLSSGAGAPVLGGIRYSANYENNAINFEMGIEGKDLDYFFNIITAAASLAQGFGF